MAAIFVANLIRFKREGFKPDRDLILALTSDEEGGDWNGAGLLVREHRSLVDAAYGLNEGGRGQIKDGKKLANTVGTSEKVYLSFRLEARNPGGHSSLPRADNAIYALAAALGRLASYSFPVRLTETTRVYFERLAASQPAALAADMRAVAKTPPDPAAVGRLSEVPLYNSTLRTTCVATRLEGGHADNALPQAARAVVNCRMHPSDPPDSVRERLVAAVADPGITVTAIGSAHPSPESPLNPELFGAVEKITEAMWPGVPVLPDHGHRRHRQPLLSRRRDPDVRSLRHLRRRRRRPRARQGRARPREVLPRGSRVSLPSDQGPLELSGADALQVRGRAARTST